MLINIFIKSLTKLGLTEFEARVYEYLATQKKANFTELAKQLVTNRMNIYRAMAKLEEFELINKDKTTGQFTITSPNKILSLLRYQEIEFSRISDDYSAILPYILDNFYLDKKEPKVQIFEGRRDFMRLMNQTIDDLKPESELLWLCEGEELYEIVDIQYFNLELGSKRKAKKVKARILAGFDNVKIFNQENQNKELDRKIKRLPKGFSSLGTISIAGDKVVLWNTVNPRAVLIDDKVMAGVFTSIFEYIWKGL
jgi:sugar-specific transcriptional regulator TrmB